MSTLIVWPTEYVLTIVPVAYWPPTSWGLLVDLAESPQTPQFFPSNGCAPPPQFNPTSS
jgi:hypothetical protein